MTVTRVPIQPVKKGSMLKLWMGILLAVLLAAGLAWVGVKALPSVETTQSGLQITTLTPGEGASPVDGDVTLVNYEGRLPDNSVFDAAEQQAMPVSGVVPGFSEGLKKMQKGGKYRLKIPSALGYGSTPPPGSPIPADTDLTFDVELLDFKSEAEIQAMQQQMQQLQQMQQGGGQPPAPSQGN